MKVFVAIMSGFCLTLVVFGVGVATTVAFLTAEPHRPPSLNAAATPWTAKAVTVKTAEPDNAAAQPRPASPENPPQAQAHENIPEATHDAAETVDPVTTAAVSSEPTPEPTRNLSAAHVEWCSQRYRSYDSGDNSYNAYSGARRECISPYSDAMDSSNSEKPNGEALVSAAQPNEMPSAYLNSEHVQSCFDRYRSYQPEDNTYQPYDGGPRRQCE